METTNDAAPAATPDELVLKLRKPVEFATLPYAEIRLREPTGAEMLQWDQLSGVASTIKAVSVVGSVPEGAVKQIVVRDLIAAREYLSRFTTRRDPEKPAGGELAPERTLQLRRPIEANGVSYTELKLREPTAADLMTWDTATGVEADCKMIAAVTGIPELTAQRLFARDLMEAAGYLAGFLAPAPSAGAPS